jgi:hypothetical protein
MLCPILISGTKVDAFTVHEKHVEEDDVLPLATVLIHRPRFSVAACVRIWLDSDWLMKIPCVHSDWFACVDCAIGCHRISETTAFHMLARQIQI